MHSIIMLNRMDKDLYRALEQWDKNAMRTRSYLLVHHHHHPHHQLSPSSGSPMLAWSLNDIGVGRQSVRKLQYMAKMCNETIHVCFHSTAMVKHPKPCVNSEMFINVRLQIK